MQLCAKKNERAKIELKFLYCIGNWNRIKKENFGAMKYSSKEKCFEFDKEIQHCLHYLINSLRGTLPSAQVN